MRSNGNDVNDGTRNLMLDHHFDGFLHQEEGRANIDGENGVEQLWRGVDYGTAVGHAGAVNQPMQGTESVFRFGNDVAAGCRIGNVSGDESGIAAGSA
ncbi:hypothetical protein D3C72_1536700 [compost metagenome]